MVKAIDEGKFFRIQADNRNLNYNQFFIEGKTGISTIEDYHSHNADVLNKDQIKDILTGLGIGLDSSNV